MSGGFDRERAARDRALAEIVHAVERRAASAEQAEQERRRAFGERSLRIWERRCRVIAGRGPGRTLLLSLLLIAGWAAWTTAQLGGLDRALVLIDALGTEPPRERLAALRPLLAPSLALAMLLTALWASYLTALTVARRGAARCGLFERAAGGMMKALILLAVLGGAVWLVGRVIWGAWSGEPLSRMIVFLAGGFVLAQTVAPGRGPRPGRRARVGAADPTRA